MADLSDVVTALKALIVATLYPNGTSNPNSPVNSLPTIIYSGWPLAKNLDAAMAAGKVMVSIFPGQTERNTGRGTEFWQVVGTVSGSTANIVNEIGRSLRDFQISIWANNPVARDATAAPIDAALRKLSRIPLADGSTAWNTYSRSAQDDGHQKEGVYVRHIFFSIEYAVYETGQATVITTVTSNVSGGIDPSMPAIETITVPETP